MRRYSSAGFVLDSIWKVQQIRKSTLAGGLSLNMNTERSKFCMKASNRPDTVGLLVGKWLGMEEIHLWHYQENTMALNNRPLLMAYRTVINELLIELLGSSHWTSSHKTHTQLPCDSNSLWNNHRQCSRRSDLVDDYWQILHIFDFSKQRWEKLSPDSSIFVFQCMAWSWYLANDMQFTLVLAPIFITLVSW